MGISSTFQYILQKAQEGASMTPPKTGVQPNLTQPIETQQTPLDAPKEQKMEMLKTMPDWFFSYIGSGNIERGKAILDRATSTT